MQQHTRRTFVKTMAIGTTAVAVIRWPMEGAPAPAPDPVQPPASPGWGTVAGQARYRIDGIPKVTGQKIFARDFHPRDIPGWPAAATWVHLLPAVYPDRPFLRVNTDKLPEAIRPTQVIQQPDLDAAGIGPIWFDSPSTLLVEPNSIPVYLGQPVAFLFFKDAASYRAATRLMQFDPTYVEYGPAGKIPERTKLGSPYYYIRYSQGGQEVFSQVTAQTPVNPTGSTPCDAEAKKYQEMIQGLLNQPPAGWQLFSSTTTTQTIDPMFMEPQTGMAYMYMVDGQRVLDLVVGTQSPDGDASTLCGVLNGPTNHPDVINMYSCYPGGGFGGRDTSLFSYFLAIAASFAQAKPAIQGTPGSPATPATPVRLAFDRFGQFQSGLKRSGSKVKQTFAVTPDGKLQVVQSTIAMVAGGKKNYSPYVAELAGICGAGAYSVPMNDILAQAHQTIGPTAGSMRGFGGPQAFFAVEHLIDEIAASLSIDPIDLRLRNVLSQGDYTVTGAPVSEPLALREICELARDNPLWKNRAREKQRRSGGATAYGVGFALANQAYGTGTDPTMGQVALGPDGSVTVTTNAVDMGNGSATSLALATARWLGANASSIEMGDPTFYWVLNLTTNSDCPDSPNPCAPPPTLAQSQKSRSPAPAADAVTPHVRSRGGHPPHAAALAPAPSSCPAPPPPNPWTNSCYTASIFGSSSACVTAFQQMHVMEQASRIVFLTGILPAASSLWKTTPDPATVRWQDGQLVAPNLPPLPRALLASEVYRLGLTTGATAHALYQGQWVTADWQVGPTMLAGLPIDALAVSQGGGAYQRIVRQNVVPPPVQAQYYGRSLYAPSGTLAAVEIDKSTGAVRLVDIVTYVDAGKPIQRQILAGQYEGAVAMGFGYTFLEHMPQGFGGPGEGTWNLNRYGLALASDLPPLDRMRLVTLREDSHPKGIAEAVLCPIAPALANAASYATGQFYQSLPITMQQLREGLS